MKRGGDWTNIITMGGVATLVFNENLAYFEIFSISNIRVLEFRFVQN